MYYAYTDTHYYRFSTELARDEWVSRSPHSRAACDPPADTSGFLPYGRESESKLREPVSPKGWKPMDTAPRDGSPIVIKRGITIQEAHWHNDAKPPCFSGYAATCSCGQTFFHRIQGSEGWMTYDEAVEFLKP